MVSLLERQIKKISGQLGINELFVRFRDDVISNSCFPTYADAKNDFDRLYLSDLLEKNNCNITNSAKDAGRSRWGLHKMLKRANLNARQEIFEWSSNYDNNRPYDEVRRDFEILYWHNLLLRTQGNATLACKIAGVSARYGLIRHAKKYIPSIEEYRWMDWPKRL